MKQVWTIFYAFLTKMELTMARCLNVQVTPADVRICRCADWWMQRCADECICRCEDAKTMGEFDEVRVENE